MNSQDAIIDQHEELIQAVDELQERVETLENENAELRSELTSTKHELAETRKEVTRIDENLNGSFYNQLQHLKEKVYSSPNGVPTTAFGDRQYDAKVLSQLEEGEVYTGTELMEYYRTVAGISTEEPRRRRMEELVDSRHFERVRGGKHHFLGFDDE